MAAQMQEVDTLIVVCCHAIWFGGSTKGEDESEWLIESFQKGETPTFIQHIRAGVEALSQNPRAILVFSGGATKQDRTSLTEAESYYNLAIAQDLFGIDKKRDDDKQNLLGNWIFQEKFATDSYQNILFSLIQFPLFSQRYLKMASHINGHLDSKNGTYPDIREAEFDTFFPQKLVIISHEFKRSRFIDLHLPAIKWTRKIDYIGINPPFDSIKMAEIEEGDRKRGYGAWKDDIYGNGKVLAQKKAVRGFDVEDFKQCFLERLDDELAAIFSRLLTWDGQDRNSLFPETLPW